MLKSGRDATNLASRESGSHNGLEWFKWVKTMCGNCGLGVFTRGSDGRVVDVKVAPAWNVVSFSTEAMASSCADKEKPPKRNSVSVTGG